MSWLRALLVVGCALSCAAQKQPETERPANVERTAVERTAQQETRPSTEHRPDPSPSKFREEHKAHNPPALAVSGAEVQRSAERFIVWASESTVQEKEDVRKSIAAVHENREIASAFCNDAFESSKRDHSRALVALALLGEMRHPAGQECFVRFIHLPLPEGGHVVDGEIVEQTSLGMLQAKAVDGLAYLHDPKADEEVLWAVSKHPSRIVRAEAIEAYLWNHQDSAQAREALGRYVHPDEKIFLDRVRREQGENAETFNRKLEAYLKSHPDRVAPKPEIKAQKPEKRQEARDERERLKPTPPPAQ